MNESQDHLEILRPTDRQLQCLTHSFGHNRCCKKYFFCNPTGVIRSTCHNHPSSLSLYQDKEKGMRPYSCCTEFESGSQLSTCESLP